MSYPPLPNDYNKKKHWCLFATDELIYNHERTKKVEDDYGYFYIGNMDRNDNIPYCIFKKG